jgi:hypothetical protein
VRLGSVGERSASGGFVAEIELSVQRESAFWRTATSDELVDMELP